MSLKETTQLSFSDGFMHQSAHLCEMDDILELLDWQLIERTLSVIEIKDTGNSAYPALLMFKIHLLQVWYNLSDPQMEKQLSRDLLFRRFVGLPLHLASPDHSTLWRFRQKLSQLGLDKTLFKTINAQLTKKRLLIKQGSVAIIDATVVQSATENDADADWASKANSKGKTTSTHGYKIHANSDEDGFVQEATLTPASPHDSTVFEEIIDTENNVEVYADSAYKSEKHDTRLQELGITNNIHERAYRNTPLTDAQKQRNREKSTIRNTIERVFAHLKNNFGMARMRYTNMARNAVRVTTALICHNLKNARRFMALEHPKSVKI